MISDDGSGLDTKKHLSMPSREANGTKGGPQDLVIDDIHGGMPQSMGSDLGEFTGQANLQQ